jgi:1-acyl-sn-glycerol-3-phosphate acyltransferase
MSFDRSACRVGILGTQMRTHDDAHTERGSERGRPEAPALLTSPDGSPLPGALPSAEAYAREAAARGEGPLRHRLFGGRIGVEDPRHAVRAAVGLGLWLPGPVLLARLLGRRGRRRAMHAVERWWGRRVIAHLNVRLDVSGFKHVDPRESYVVAPLHEGFLDIPALLHLPLDLRFVARDELFTWPLFGPLLRDTGHVLVSPERPAWSYRKLRRELPPILAGGESVVIFPQGGILGIEIDFLGGPFALARALRRPILPVALTGGHRTWEYPYTPRLRYGQRMSLHALPPIPATETATRPAEDVRREVMARLKDLALSGALVPPRRFVPARDGYWDGYAYAIDPAFPALAADVARRGAFVAAQAGAQLDTGA